MKKDAPTQLDLATPVLAPEECLAEARKHAPLIKGPKQAQKHPAIVARILELQAMSGIPKRIFFKQAALNPPTMGYYARNRHSDNQPWPELEQLRSNEATPATRRRRHPDDAGLSSAQRPDFVVVGAQMDGTLIVEERTERLVRMSDDDYNTTVVAVADGQASGLVVGVKDDGTLVLATIRRFVVPKGDSQYVGLLARLIQSERAAAR